jgi:hypothetical protein
MKQLDNLDRWLQGSRRILMNYSPQMPQDLDLAKVISAFLTRTRNVTATSKQVLRAALSGVCVASYLAILTQPHVDKALTIAVGSFAVALPTLVFCFFTGAREAIDPKEALYSPDVSIRVALSIEQILVFFATWFDLLGFLAIMVGIAAIIFHLSSAAGSIFLLTIGLLAVSLFILGGIYVVQQVFVKK